MALSYYSTTRPGSLAVAMNSSTTLVSLVDASTFPDPAGPGNSEYTVIVGYGSDREEVCTVTGKAGDTLTVLRGMDSTASTAKNQGDVVVHGVSARDFDAFALEDDPRFGDPRTPLAHAGSHMTGGTDPIGSPTVAEMNAAIAAAVRAFMPIGTVLMWYSNGAPPTGWLVCNGSPISGVLYPGLKAICGNNLPQFQTRFPRGSVGPLPEAGGSDEVTLDWGQMPSHYHETQNGVNFVTSQGSGGSYGLVAGINLITTSTRTAYSGSGVPFDNRPAYLGVNFIIKAL